MLDAHYKSVVESDDTAYPISLTSFCTSAQWLADVSCRWVDVVDGKSDIGIDWQTVPQPLFKKNFDLLEDDIYYKSADLYKVFLISDNSRQLQRLLHT